MNELVGLAGMQNPGEPAHLRTRLVLEFLEPVVHNPALPSVIDRIGGCHGCVE